MRRLVLVSLVATIAAVGLAAGGAGSASLPPALFVVDPTSNAPGNHEPLLTLLASTSDTLSAASMSIYVPTGYGLDLTLPKGTKVGGVVALPNFDASDLVVDDPAAFTADPCAPGTHAAVWTTSMTISGQPTTVPIFLDPTTGTDTARGAYRLTYCQTSIALLVLETGLTAPTTPGAYTWRAFVQPPGVAPAAPDPNAVYELRSVVEIPHSLAAKARYDTRDSHADDQRQGARRERPGSAIGRQHPPAEGIEHRAVRESHDESRRDVHGEEAGRPDGGLTHADVRVGGSEAAGRMHRSSARPSRVPVPDIRLELADHLQGTDPQAPAQAEEALRPSPGSPTLPVRRTALNIHLTGHQ